MIFVIEEKSISLLAPSQKLFVILWSETRDPLTQLVARRHLVGPKDQEITRNFTVFWGV